MINRSNYEVWFIDYADGKLSHEHVAELLLFLEENPDLKNEFGFFEPVELPVDKVEFPFKENLKKTKPSNMCSRAGQFFQSIGQIGTLALRRVTMSL